MIFFDSCVKNLEKNRSDFLADVDHLKNFQYSAGYDMDRVNNGFVTPSYFSPSQFDGLVVRSYRQIVVGDVCSRTIIPDARKEKYYKFVKRTLSDIDLDNISSDKMVLFFYAIKYVESGSYEEFSDFVRDNSFSDVMGCCQKSHFFVSMLLYGYVTYPTLFQTFFGPRDFKTTKENKSFLSEMSEIYSELPVDDEVLKSIKCVLSERCP